MQCSVAQEGRRVAASSEDANQVSAKPEGGRVKPEGGVGGRIGCREAQMNNQGLDSGCVQTLTGGEVNIIQTSSD